MSTQNSISFYNWPLKPLVLSAFSIGIALGSGIAYGMANAPTADNSCHVGQVVTLADYERIHVGMTLTEARTILGTGTEIQRTQTTVIITWANNDGSKIMAIFQENKLTEKSQDSLLFH